MPAKFIEKDVRKSKNNYPNISMGCPLFAVYFQKLGEELKYQHIYYIPNATAKKEVIDYIVRRASNNNTSLYSDE